jgi:hypothetical protein
LPAFSPSSRAVRAPDPEIVHDKALSFVATFTWQTSKSAVASADVTGKASSVAEGTTDITAAYGAAKSAAVAVTVPDNTPWRTTGTAASALIDDAVKQGALTSEQGLVYRVFAAFGDPRLPKEYRGPQDNTLDSPGLREAAAR